MFLFRRPRRVQGVCRAGAPCADFAADRASTAADTSTRVLEDIPEVLTCPICLDLMADPVAWPAPHCGEHSFCRECLERSVHKLSSRCPICRTPARIDDVWSLPCNGNVVALLESDFPERHAESMRRSQLRRERFLGVPRLNVPVLQSFEQLLSQHSERDISRLGCRPGTKINLTIFSPSHYLLLATSISSHEASANARFGLLLEGQSWGFVAGIVSPRFPKRESVSEALAKLYFDKGGFTRPITLTVLLVDTFTLDGAPRPEECDTGAQDIFRRAGLPDCAVLMAKVVTGDAKRAMEQGAAVSEA